MNKSIKRIVKPLARWAAKRSPFAEKVISKIRFQKQARVLESARLYSAINEKTVIFMSFGGRNLADSPKVIFLEMVKDPYFADWNFIWALKGQAFRDFANVKYPGLFDFQDKHVEELTNDERNFLNRTEIVRYGSQDFYKALAKSKYWVSNFRLPDGINPSNAQTFIQTWHGTPIKRLGADIETSKTYPTKTSEALIEWYKLEAGKWDILLAQSEYFAEKISSAFSFSSLDKTPVVIFEGSPRNVPLAMATAEQTSKIRESLNLPKGKKVALYAPTFRDNQHSSSKGHTYSINLELDELKSKLDKDWVILFRVHYLVKNSINFDAYKGFIWDVSSYRDINDLYIASDILISDYSSSMIDFAVLDRPIISFAYDLDQYETELRGFYISTEEFPGPVVQTQTELQSTILNIDELEKLWKGRRAKFVKKFSPKDDSRTAERIVSKVFKS